MSNETSDVVRRGYEAFGRGDIEGLISLLDENVEWISSGPPEVPTAGTRRGHEQVREFFQTVNELFEFDRFEPQTFIAQDDKVVVLGVDAVRLRANNQALEDNWAHVFTVRNGKITHFQEYIDTSALVEALRGAEART